MKRIEMVSILNTIKSGLIMSVAATSFVMAQQKVNVSGIVKDEYHGIGYSSITFKNLANSQWSDATLSDVNGSYKLNLVPGNYEITIDAIDFKKFSQTINIEKEVTIAPIIMVSERKANLDNTKEIEGVVIKATSTKPYKVELDKKIYDPSQDIVSKGGSLQDVLSNVPSVEVDTDGTVSMRGSSNVKFLINGKPSALLGIDDGANALQSIPADQIEKIEVITNPSSKFEASGTAGILNIILKKSKKAGFNGSVIGSFGYLPQTNFNTNLSLRKENLTLFFSGGTGYKESKNTRRNNINYDNNGINELSSRNTESITNSKGLNYNTSTGFIYNINDKTSINASGTIRAFDHKNNGYTDTYENAFAGTSDFTQRLNTGINENLALQGDFGLDHKFDDKGQNISLSFSLQRNRSKNGTDINEKKNNVFNLQDIINQKTVQKTIVGKVDYELPIGENSILTAGYRLDMNRNNYNNNVLESTIEVPTLTNLGLYTYTADYKEVFNAFYLQFKSKIGKLGYQIGLRDEISNITINYYNFAGVDAISNKKKNYNNLFPSIFLSYEISKDNQFLVNYSRRIDRPKGFFLIPNPNYDDNLNIFDGNIDLNPSYVDSFEIGYSISKSKFTLNPTIYYRHQTEDSKTISYSDALGVIHTKPVNVGTDDKYGLEFNFNWDATRWLKFLGNVDFFGYKTKGVYFDASLMNKAMSFDGDGFSFRSRLTSTFKIDKTFSFQVQGFYRGPQKTASQEKISMYAINLGASKTILNGNGILSFNIQDLFNTRAMRRINYSDGFVKDAYMQFQPRQFVLSFTYKFKQGEKIEQPKKKKEGKANENNDEEQGAM